MRTQENQRPPVRCYGCGKLGHIHRFCPTSKWEGSQPVHKAKTVGGSWSDDEGAFTASVQCSQSEQWVVDSGASSHMTRQKEPLIDYVEFKQPEKIGLGDGTIVEAVGVGNLRVNMLFKEGSPKRSVFYRVLYVPKLACNLFSVRAATAKGNMVKFGHSKCWIRDAKGRLKGMGSLEGSLYRLDCQPFHTECAAVCLERNEVEFRYEAIGEHAKTEEVIEVEEVDTTAPEINPVTQHRSEQHPVPVQSIVGGPTYADVAAHRNTVRAVGVCIRPDISFAVGRPVRACDFTSKPKEAVAKQVVHHPKGTVYIPLKYSNVLPRKGGTLAANTDCQLSGSIVKD